MRKYLFLATLIGFGAQARTFQERSARIVGGVVSDITKHIYTVSLQQNGRHFCGGSLIDKHYVLTAGHCVDWIDATKIKVVIGSQNHVQGASEGETHSVLRATTHPEFENSFSTLTHDFAIIELADNSRFTPVPLIGQDENAYELATDHMSLVLGWGTTSEGGSLSSTLLEVGVPLVVSTDCENAYPGQIDETMICAGFKEGGKDSCQGDSGGPLVINTAEGNEILTGIVSWGEGCARPEKYGVYSDISFASKWIGDFIHPASSVAQN